MNKLQIKIIVLFTIYGLFISSVSMGQSQKTIVLIDDEGHGISNVSVLNENIGSTLWSNEDGAIDISMVDNSAFKLKAEGYESQWIFPDSIDIVDTVQLSPSLYRGNSEDVIDMPFGKMNKRQIAGAVNTAHVSDILLYDGQRSYRSIISGRFAGLFGSSNIRQFGAPTVIVDGIPRSAANYNPEQIESVSVVKDLASSMLYGSEAGNGLVLINTKKGDKFKKSIRFRAEKGISSPISLPKYLGAADYMELYNEALINDGLDIRYTADEIQKTRQGIDPTRYPDEDLFNSDYLNDLTFHHNIVGEVSGGNQAGQYYLNVGWSKESGLIKVGEGANEQSNRLNMRGNINYNITDHIQLMFNSSAIFNISSSPRYSRSSLDFWSMGSEIRPNRAPILIPSNLLEDESLLSSAKLIDGQYLLGGSREYPYNVYGELSRNGRQSSIDRQIELSTKLKFDLGSILKGLSASVFFSFDMYNLFVNGIDNAYAVYQPIYSEDGSILSWSKYGTDVKVESPTMKDVGFYRRAGIYGTLDYNRNYGKDHKLMVTTLMYSDQYNSEDVFQVNKHLHFGVRANYIYKDKYVAELTGVYQGSGKLLESNRWAMSPGIGLAWIMSEEKFLKDSDVFDFVKARANWAVVNTMENVNDYYNGINRYSDNGYYYYGHGSYYNNGRILNIGNPFADYEKKMNFNLGVETQMFNNSIGIDISYFYYKYFDILQSRSNILPSYFESPPLENFGSYQTQGLEFDLTYYRKVGKVDVSLGSNVSYSIPKALEVNELTYPENESYRQIAGKQSDGIFGYVATGLFQSQTEIDNAPVQTFGKVQPGDIRYEDLNNDGQITDADRKIIGNSRARLQLGLHFHLKYKSLELFALGTGQYGQDRSFTNSYYWVYGDRKYSDEVLGRWTPETAASATYPRLTSQTSANNYRNSTFWTYKNDWFSLNTLQLSYTLKDFISLETCQVYLRGSNIATISELKEKTQLNIGSRPQMRSYTAGLNINF
ncbi:SusC/RagA family TonB-linked outer membrane protein [Membranihabitans marinus]|uniref:SusC/RagA family TonB-linked outer membrane protein n=1 Tax=Membranihabitans marinus TaxID=1227546 RepID=UPI001F012CE7|nr:SusC/RagA family TonB-linked outer membrane protein [Membranihabitans marinus]